jgi:hypothetical protein
LNPVKINAALNFVIPLYGDNDQIYAYVHSTPVSYEVFEANFWLVSKTYTSIHESGLGATAGPRVAALILKDIAKEIAGGRGDPVAIGNALLGEIRRLSTAIVRQDDSWQPVPYQVAIDRGMIDRQDATEVDSAIVFFTVEWLMLPRQRRLDMLDGAAQIWNARMSSLSPTEFINSLATSTEIVNSGGTVAA